MWRRSLVAGVLVFVVALSPQQARDKYDYGPMAVINDPAIGLHFALHGPGVVSITDRCVMLKPAQGKPTILVWRSAEVGWDEGNRQVLWATKANKTAPSRRIRDGDVITVGGGEAHSPKWLSPPDPSCLKGITGLFVVHSVLRQ